jgi:hypothetical protein
VSNSKSYNSILFLTTLSVYLGLVLVGASPSVLAQQAALSQKFEIQKEIETEDDLDKNPDDDLESLTRSIESYFDDLEGFVEDLRKLHSISKFDLSYDKFSISENGFVQCNVDGDIVRHSEQTKEIDNRWLDPAITDARYAFETWDLLSDCLPTDKFQTGTATSVRLMLRFDTSELRIEFSRKKSSSLRAAHLAEKFNEARKLYEIDEQTSVILESLFQNTVFKSENQHFLIVTTLPRGSLDALVQGEKQAN